MKSSHRVSLLTSSVSLVTMAETIRYLSERYEQSTEAPKSLFTIFLGLAP